MPIPSDVTITYDGTDITDHVLYSTARFEAQASAGVGTFSFSVKDVDQTMEFTTGKEVVLTLDNKRYFGGYLMQHGQTFAFPAVDTTTVSAVTARQHTLQGVNYNVWFDRLVAHNVADHLRALPRESTTDTVGFLVKRLMNNYLNLPSGFDGVTFIDDIGPVQPNLTTGWGWVNGGEQGISFRQEMERVSAFYGLIYFFDANKRLHVHAPESLFSRWGFSDRPNQQNVSSSLTSFGGATYGFREMETSQDITDMVNDALVWGGTYLIASTDPNDPSGIVFARRQDSESIALHGRWQLGENGIGDELMADQQAVTDRAAAIVFGGEENIVGADPSGVIRQRTHPNWTVRLAWYAHDVPTLGPAHTVKDHLTPGDIVTIVLYVHGNGLAHPRILTLPCRRVTISFPTLPSNTEGDLKTYVRFEGEFSLSLNDPWSLWEAILRRRRAVRQQVALAGSPDQAGAPGGQWSGQPDENPNGVIKTFHLSSSGNEIAYVAGSSEVHLNGLLLRKGSDYMESPANGYFTVFVAPPTGSSFWVTVRLV